jgi:hypothetical protein
LWLIDFEELPESGLTPAERQKLCEEKAQPIFQECCIAPLAKLSAEVNVGLSSVCTSGGLFGCGDGGELTRIYAGLDQDDPKPDRAALYRLVNTTCDFVQKDMGRMRRLSMQWRNVPAPN